MSEVLRRVNAEGVEVLVVIDVATFVPRCEVCTQLIPSRRLNGKDHRRTKHTCSAECERVLADAQKFRTDQRVCPNCLRPRTMAEIEEFRKWRKDSGRMRQGPGNPDPGSARSKLNRRDLVKALKKGMKLLEEEAAFKPEAAEFLVEAKNLIDGKAVEKRTLHAGGETAAVSEGDEDAKR